MCGTIQACGGGSANTSPDGRTELVYTKVKTGPAHRQEEDLLTAGRGEKRGKKSAHCIVMSLLGLLINYEYSCSGLWAIEASDWSFCVKTVIRPERCYLYNLKKKKEKRLQMVEDNYKYSLYI